MNASDLDLAIEQLPVFSAIKPESIVADLSDLLESNRRDVEALTKIGGPPGWENFVEPLEEIGDRLSRFFSPIGHLHGVADSDELRAAYNEAIPLLSAYGSEMAQNDGLFDAFSRLRNSDSYSAYSNAQKKVIDNALRDFRLGGIALESDKRERFRAINQELAQLTTRFGENVLDATQSWRKDVPAREALPGLPDSALALTRQAATKDGVDGYRLTLDYPCYMPVMTYCDNRELRQELYEAYVTRASDQGPDEGRYDNSANIDRILTLRHELANCLGFDNYAEYSLETKMAPSVPEVIAFLEQLAVQSRPAAVRDFAELQSFAASELGMARVEAWDVAYCSEKLRQHSFAFSQEELRPYFPADRVVAGLFETVHRLFDVEVTALDGVDRWHPDVMAYQIRDAAGELRGLFYLDLYAREQKRGGAWMDECIVRRVRDRVVQTPVAYLTCNFTPPVDGQKSLLTHDEVLTLFHEFGHGLHHMLTRVNEAAVSGINGVPWDGVELPSQFLENWCWEREALDLIAGHVETGAPIPDELIERMHAAKNFQAGLQMVRQIELSLFDFRLHAEYRPGMSVQGLLDDVRARVAVIVPPAYNRFQHGFSHVFAGGYAAGYYSYKWAEVLSADAFSRFETEGVFNRETGLDFLNCILERGGAEDTLELFKRFRGREPEIEPLLRHAGLVS
ncbi:MAG: M3 family metallopeptidase [Gammaproteobacteria bacterium]|jgi:oligopeptidase A